MSAQPEALPEPARLTLTWREARRQGVLGVVIEGRILQQTERFYEVDARGVLSGEVVEGWIPRSEVVRIEPAQAPQA